jgi:hypothetical protein
MEKPKAYRVYEDIAVLLETDDRKEAIEKMKSAHRKDRTKFHEVHRFNALGDGRYCGTDQLSPGDCPECGRRPETCKCSLAT